jgi:hypothetical protein
LATQAVGFSEPTGRAAEGLCAELQSSWLILAGLIDRLSEASSSLRNTPLSSSSLRATREQYEAETRLLLVEPLDQFLRVEPIRKSLEAIQRYDHAFGASARGRSGADSRFQRVLAQTAIDLCEPWRIRLRGDYEDEWQAWRRRCASHAKEASALLEKYARWARETNEEATSLKKQQDNSAREQRYSQWSRQNRAVLALLEVEVALRDLGVTWLAASQDFVEKAHGEREEILSKSAQTLDWIRMGADTGETAPGDTLVLVSPDERLGAWIQAIEAESNRRLPEHVELVVPGRYPRWRSIAPRQVFLAAFAAHARDPVRKIVEHYWSLSAGMLREAARAREIVDYWREASPSNSGEQKDLFADARHNAASMLVHQLETPTGIEELQAKLINALNAWNEEGSTSIDATLFGWAVFLHRPRGRKVLGRAALRLGRQKAHAAAERTGRWAADRLDRTLESFGGRIPARPTLKPVVRRTTLRDTLSLPASKISNLPALYRTLFRVTAPVEDRRFLVGRNQELAGLEQAVRDWEAGRFAACLVIGARGSGKTSLLNCAARDIFGEHTLVRGQFGERALSRGEIDAFLRQLLGLKEGADLEAAFAAERRILVIEESERTYLRKVGGFEGAHYLIRLIHRTASTTLWIIVMNDRALRVLDAGAQFHRVFSHRINATSVSRENLERAILERHRLSGMRLDFAAPPAEDPRVSRVKGWIGLQASPQKLFFDSLFQQSEGVLRSALELWLSSIDRVEGETLKIRQPLDPAFSAFRSELAQEDQFTLLAIQEHGSLTQNELAEVLCETYDSSRSRLDRLAALGLIEPDPEHPGLRVRPEAQRFTNDVLRRANLT